jgi:CelD/BcsL family acetyltransferase involved in cellulose biosynthesis
MLGNQIISDFAGLHALAAEWSALLARSSSNEPVLTPTWLSTWWQIYGEPEGRELRTVAFRDGARLVGLAPLCLRRCTRLPWTGLFRLELLGSGEERDDGVCSEYLGLIAERGAEESVVTSFAALLSTEALAPWDHLVLEALNGDGLVTSLLTHELRRRGLHVQAELDCGAACIALPSTWDAYLASLPVAHRHLIERSLAHMDRWAAGDLRFHRATNTAEVDEGRRILIDLHNGRWAAAGRQGAFANRRFGDFHERMMSWLFDNDALDLTWLTVRNEPVAASYNVIWNNKVYYYQGGRSLAAPAKVRPGLVLHAHNIRAAIDAGRREYDLLGGLPRYKIELAATARPILRLRVVQPSLRESLTQFAAILRRQIRAARTQPDALP